jgi:IS1 family transposase
MNDVEMAYTDVYPSYTEVFEEDTDIKHIVAKAETCLVESFNSAILSCQITAKNQVLFKTRENVDVICKIIGLRKI